MPLSPCVRLRLFLFVAAFGWAAVLVPAGCTVAGNVEPAELVLANNTGEASGGGRQNTNDVAGGVASTGSTANSNSNGTLVTGNETVGSSSPNATLPSKAFVPGVAMYWGTGNDNGVDPDLSTLCQDSDISIIILSFLDTIASHSSNANGNPHMSINDCPTPYNNANPHLGNCPSLGAKITACQAQGKQVIASIGGAGANVSFVSDAEAIGYATLIWNMFLGGPGTIRPFGSTTTLDGIDLDIENGPITGYAAFVLELRRLMLTDTRKSYLITAAPQCPFRDEWMGPDGQSSVGTTLKGTALTLALTAFDHLFVQFYNNYCEYSSLSDFNTAWNDWTALGAGQPKIWVGLPATVDGADKAGYVTPSRFGSIVTAVGASPHFGGLMFWDAGYDADWIAKGNTPVRASAAAAVAKASSN